jgi:hypothetical protein
VTSKASPTAKKRVLSTIKSKASTLASTSKAYASKTIGGLSEKYIGSDVTSGLPSVQAGKPTSTTISASSTGKGKHRRKGKVPKTVKKWAHRIVSRRKQEEKIVKALFGNDGGKLIKKAKKGSVGIITPQERAYALSR